MTFSWQRLSKAMHCFRNKEASHLWHTIFVHGPTLLVNGYMVAFKCAVFRFSVSRPFWVTSSKHQDGNAGGYIHLLYTVYSHSHSYVPDLTWCHRAQCKKTKQLLSELKHVEQSERVLFRLSIFWILLKPYLILTLHYNRIRHNKEKQSLFL